MAKNLSAIRTIVRQLLRDEFVEGTDFEFEDNEIEIHIQEVLVEISQRKPYEVKETVVSDGTKEVDLSGIEDLIGEKVEKVEYPVGEDPQSFQDFSIFGNTLRIEDETPTSGEDIYLYCHKVHQLTESSSSLTSDLENVLVKGAAAKTADAWLNKMRDQITPQTANWYHAWVNKQLAFYEKALDSITPAKGWEF